MHQVADDMGDKVDILKLDVDEHQELASALQVRQRRGALGAPFPWGRAP